MYLRRKDLQTKGLTRSHKSKDRKYNEQNTKEEKTTKTNKQIMVDKTLYRKLD
jgi:hypothetical protein